MARIKINKETTIKDWNSADGVLARIGDFQRRITIIEAAANEQVDFIKADMAAEIEPLKNEIKIATEDLELFATLHGSDFGKAKSRKLNFGVIGWRQSTKITAGKRAVELIKAVFGNQAKKYLKMKETVSKDDLKALGDGDLKKIDCRRTSEEVFYVEPEVVEADKI